jgi:hypothetical protein
MAAKQKMRTMYQVRYEQDAGQSTKQVGHKMRLMDRVKAMRVVRFLKKRGVDALIAPIQITA